jgi:hypothetical protein
MRRGNFKIKEKRKICGFFSHLNQHRVFEMNERTEDTEKQKQKKDIAC